VCVCVCVCVCVLCEVRRVSRTRKHTPPVATHAGTLSPTASVLSCSKCCGSGPRVPPVWAVREGGGGGREGILEHLLACPHAETHTRTHAHTQEHTHTHANTNKHTFTNTHTHTLSLCLCFSFTAHTTPTHPHTLLRDMHAHRQCVSMYSRGRACIRVIHTVGAGANCTLAHRHGWAHGGGLRPPRCSARVHPRLYPRPTRSRPHRGREQSGERATPTPSARAQSQAWQPDTHAAPTGARSGIPPVASRFGPAAPASRPRHF